MNRRRRWLALVVALFCLPLYYGLDRTDLVGDEAIYSFAAERIAADGDWLTPKNIPFVDEPFLEKPPLKFWIVAAPLAAGWLEPGEFALRVWDASFGAAAFLYVFLIGSLLFGPLAGAIAVLVLFAHQPLLFVHGLRSNTMEAPLVLSYCGGIYHFLAWQRRPRPAHGAAAALYFALGFMTKFVAALFLPLVLGLAVLLLPEYRVRTARHWRTWAGAAALAVALIGPWFVWAHRTFGPELWRWMFGVHVIERFAGTLHPEHVQPWWFYWAALSSRFSEAGAMPLVVIAAIVFGIVTVQRRSPEGGVVILWFAVPMVLLTAATSKLYHYVYPFLPPLALASGYVAALALVLGGAPFERALASFYASVDDRWPRAVAVLQGPLLRPLLIGLAAISVGIAAASLLLGTVRVDIEPFIHLRSRGILRPTLVAFVCLLAAGIPRHAARMVWTLLIVGLLPLAGYRSSAAALGVEQHLTSNASACVASVQRSASGLPQGVYADIPFHVPAHTVHYYFARVGPWVRASAPAPEQLGQYLTDTRHLRPAVVTNDVFERYAATASSLPPHVPLTPPVVLLLPGPYARCASVSALDRPLE
jgi:hypothetical protein